ncbi:MAG TPA: AI-2E family transporter [Steroidobacteraceae bacterium]|nr:AI-2E family transporter [Steroidobacteraceae bacterium]
MERDKPDSLRTPATDPSGTGSLRDRAIGIIAFATVLALLYFGRDVLIPFTVALILSLLIAPLVRRLRRIGLGRVPSVLVAVLISAFVVTAAAVILGTQVLRMAASLPQYERTIQQKLRNLDDMTVGRFNALTSEAGRLIENHPTSVISTMPAGTGSSAAAPIPVELHQPRPAPLEIIAKVLASVWVPIESTGIVLVVLVFVLLEHEALRDRFIRVAGGTNIRLTTLALNDAGERLSRFFVSQFAVNLCVGAAIGLGLAVLGVPHATLWGALATLLRFVPYVGVWLAALLASALAIAVVPGWSLALSTLGLFIVVELIAAQVVEPHLYGHTTGLSPLSVVVAAIFWSALWGPIGLVLSTPLTLCLLVVGRHIRALRFLELLLGDAQALTLPQKFYQRALSRDADEILVDARAFLKRNSFAAYCDVVLMPALHLGFLDYELGAISRDQQLKIRDLLVAVVSALSGEPRRLQRHRLSVLDDEDPGRILRQHREQLNGRWQGPVVVPAGSILLCLGLESRADTIAAELLVRALREQGLDARHVSMEDLDAQSRPPGADPAAIALVYVVSAFPSAERERSEQTHDRVRQHLPNAKVVSVFLPGISIQNEPSPRVGNADHAVSSLVGAVELCLETATRETVKMRRPGREG